MQIEKDRYEQLLDYEKQLNALHNGGVDNWEWYGESMKEYHEQKEKEEQLKQTFEEILETLCEGVEEPAGRGAGYGFKPEYQDSAFKLFREAVE